MRKQAYWLNPRTCVCFGRLPGARSYVLPVESVFRTSAIGVWLQIVLALSKKAPQHVPYRSSKLTHFLKDSIGGNCRTRLIACIWSDVGLLHSTCYACIKFPCAFICAALHLIAVALEAEMLTRALCNH